jgi:predicted CXXCH cytochrome family protein
LLAAAGQELCFTCHDAMGEKVTKSAVKHPALAGEKGCMTCHSPHASDQEKLLLRPQKETCLGCHAKIITPAMKVVHKPVEMAGCTACHDPHGSPHPRLLTASFPSEPYAPYTETSYELCFGCHSRELVQYADTSFATGFRDGERNLHFVHVNRPKGRSCLLCHSPHGAGNPKLIAESVPFGGWQLPIRFVKTETGGGCSPGCHRPQPYDRENPGRKPPAWPGGR